MCSRTGWAAAAAGFVAGLAGGLFGVGGGILLVPLLTAFFSLTQHQAHGTSLGAIGATAIAGLVVYGLNGNVAWLPAALLAVGSLPAARWGAQLAVRTRHDRLRLAFAAFLLVVAARILWRVPIGTPDHALTGVAGALAGLAAGVGVGLLSGFMGVGGGILAVPSLTLFFGMPQHLAQGTSLAVILVTAPIAALEHHRHGNVVPRLLPGLALGSIAGAPLAAYLAQGLPQETLARGFALFLVANAARMGWTSFARRRAP